MGSPGHQQVPPPPIDPPPADARAVRYLSEDPRDPRSTGRRPGAPRRSRDDRMVAGVCAGVARAVGVDPTWVRLAVVALTVFGSGVGLLLYVIGWVVLPEEPDGAAFVPVDVGDQAGDDGGWSAEGATGGAWVPVTARRRGTGGAVAGALLIALGAGLLLSRLGLAAIAWPVVLVLVGAALAFTSARR